ncbi:MAG TPA: HAMP domain-containing sensor histidine kinase [Roseiarcus sp.]|jgi:signal transduction histidine kinase|nr:HAMP domain-containing sensor histidine kinase [Roseiarcus sp.]
MPSLDVFRALAFRLALAFCLAVSAATAAAFGLIYLEVSRADVERVAAVLVDEAAKSEGDSEAELRRALELRLTRDIRRLDYVALYDAKGGKLLGDVPAMPAIPVDGRAHVVREQLLPDRRGSEPALFVARRRPDGGVVLFGRSLVEAYDLQETVLRALGIALAPTILLILSIGAVFARRASRRLEGIHGAIVSVMNGEIRSRLPVANDRDDVDKVARAVNLMLDEIERLLEQLKNVGDNIAHDLRTPLMVARAKLDRALEEDAGIQATRATMRAALDQIDKASVTIAAILRVSAVEKGVRQKRFKDFDLGGVCNEVVEFYQPLSESKSIAMTLEADQPVPVFGDEDLMREAISNLVDNAVKFTPEGGRVWVEAAMVEGLPWVAVSDTGCGVPLQDREKIFRRFFRGERSEGHGLGLSIAQTIADLHGFLLTAEDNNPGVRFVMRASKAPMVLARAAE